MFDTFRHWYHCKKCFFYCTQMLVKGFIPKKSFFFIFNLSMSQNDISKVKMIKKMMKKWWWWRILSLITIDNDDDDAKCHWNYDDVQMMIWPLSLMTPPLGLLRMPHDLSIECMSLRQLDHHYLNHCNALRCICKFLRMA